MRRTATCCSRAAPAAMGQRGDLWVFGYASLIWRPEFDAAEHRGRAGARLAPRAAHALARQPRHAAAPGPGVRAAARRRLPRRGLPPARPPRPRPNSSACGRARCPPASTTRAGCPAARRRAMVPALAFTLSRRSEACLARLPDAQMLRHPAPRPRPLRQHAGLPGADRAGAARARHPRPRDRAPDGAGRGTRTASAAAIAVGLRAGAQPAGASAAAARTAARSASVSTSSSTPGSSTSTAARPGSAPAGGARPRRRCSAISSENSSAPKAQRVPAPPAVLGVGRRVVGQAPRPRPASSGRAHQRHVARQHQPAGGVGLRGDAGGDREPDAARQRRRASSTTRSRVATQRAASGSQRRRRARRPPASRSGNRVARSCRRSTRAARRRAWLQLVPWRAEAAGPARRPARRWRDQGRPCAADSSLESQAWTSGRASDRQWELHLRHSP